MAGNNPLPAGTPPADPPAGGQPGGQPVKDKEPGNEFILNQEQFNARWAEKMVSLEKELGMSTKDAKALIKAKKDADEGARSDLEKLTGERDSFKTELDGAKLQLAKMESLLEAGIPAEKIPKLLKRVSGKTTEEIKADIAEMKADGLIPTATPPAAAQGAGNAGVPGTPGAKKRWTKSEIQKVAKTADAKTLEEINLAQSEGRVDYDK
jgi:hypothetical protein